VEAAEAARVAKVGDEAVGVAPKNTRFIESVKVVDHRTGNILEGTVDLKPTLDRIAEGKPLSHRNDGSIFQNRPLRGQTTPQLPVKPQGYYKGGEIYYTPDHYTTFFRVNP
jgi:guanyl-specific ribonuclease Sa